jgi:hypothetical protein
MEIYPCELCDMIIPIEHYTLHSKECADKRIAHVALEPVVDPIIIEPIAVDPIIIEPIAVDPIIIEPIAVDPIIIEPIAMDPIIPEKKPKKGKIMGYSKNNSDFSYKKKIREFKEEIPINISDQYLSPIQQKALNYCIKKAKTYSNAVRPNAVIRFLEMGYTEETLNMVEKYLSNVDLISHIGRGNNLNWLLTEPKFKNLFEVHNKNDTTRIHYEDNLFNGYYKSDCEFSERVRYGCLNILSQPNGCASAHGYGASYIVFKKEVKDRTTFIDGDSFGGQQHICTFKNFANLLVYIRKELIDQIIKQAEFHEKNPNSSFLETDLYYQYVEAQIHGDIILKRDCEKIVFHNAVDKNFLNEFDKLGIPYCFYENSPKKRGI